MRNDAVALASGEPPGRGGCSLDRLHAEDGGDLVGPTISGGIAHFPGRAGERIRNLADLDPTLAAELLATADACDFFIRPSSDGTAPVRPDARTYSIRLEHDGRSQALTVSEPFASPELAQLVRTVRRCL